MTDDNRYIFWMSDLSVLFKNDQYIRFIPTKEMSRVEQLNAIARFGIYLFILFMLMDRKDEWLYIPLIIIIMDIILYNLFELDDMGKKKELNRIRNLESEKFLNDNDQNGNGDGNGNGNGNSDNNYGDDDQNTKYKLEAGYYDSDGKLVIGEYRGPKGMKNGINRLYSLDETREYRKNNCMRPTEDNPMMNLNVTNMNNDNIPVQCDQNDPTIQEEIKEAFNKNLMRDVDDIFEVQNSQRQFMPLNHNIPNNQEAFAKWCYSGQDSCKINPMMCVRNNDILGMYTI